MFVSDIILTADNKVLKQNLSLGSLTISFIFFKYYFCSL